MKKILTFLLALFAAFGIATAAPLSDEQKEIQALIGRLYSIDSRTFEMGRFEGKFNPQKQGKLHSVFFTEDLLATVKDVTAVDGAGFVRHPSLGSEDLSHISGIDPTKHPKMLPPVVKGDGAYIDVYPDQGRVIYFLRKTPDGWRIINTASYNLWPRNDGTCWEPFYLVKPTPEQQALESKECIQYRQSQLPKK